MIPTYTDTYNPLFFLPKCNFKLLKFGCVVKFTLSRMTFSIMRDVENAVREM